MTSFAEKRQELESKIRKLHESKTYAYHAYMSSGLTNLPKEKQDQFKCLLDELCLEVFDPQDVCLYLPHGSSDPKLHTGLKSEEVLLLDRMRVAEADFVVVTQTPKTGPG